MSYRKPDGWFVRDEYGPGEVTPWPQVEAALVEAGIGVEEWEAGLREERTVLGVGVDVPFLFWWVKGKLVAGRRNPKPKADAAERAQIEQQVDASLVREILEALCQRDGLPVDSTLTPGRPARNYELALRLGIGHVFGLPREEPR